MPESTDFLNGCEEAMKVTGEVVVFRLETKMSLSKRLWLFIKLPFTYIFKGYIEL